MSCLCGSGAADEEPCDRHWSPQSLPEQPPLLRTYARARSLRSTFITMSDGVKIAVDVTLPLVRLSKMRYVVAAPLLSPLRLVCHCVRNSARPSKLPARAPVLHCSTCVSSAFLGCAQTASQRSNRQTHGPWQYASFAAHSSLRTFQLCSAHNPTGAAVWKHRASSSSTPPCPALTLASRATRRASGLTALLPHVATAAPGGCGGR
jgi:hypothetical protein